MTPDHINAAFEGAAAIILWLNVRRLWRDRELKGVSVLPTCLYFVWCIWNLYYYAHLDQMLSWWAGWGVGAANLSWVCLALWFRRKATPRDSWNSAIVRPEDGGPGGVPRKHLNHAWRYACTSGGERHYRCGCGDWEARPD
jgi:hypothetical protein